MKWLTAPSLLWLEEHRTFIRATLHGAMLDLGGDKNSDYLSLCQGTFETASVNLNKAAGPDVVHDLEQSLPFEDSSYDGVALFNVLGHVFEYRVLSRRSARILRPGGRLVITVQFLSPVHPSPDDFNCFIASALRRELELLGLREIVVRPLGGGVFGARYALLDRLLPRPLLFLSFYTLRYGIYACDYLFNLLAYIADKRYAANDYALGYLAAATKMNPVRDLKSWYTYILRSEKNGKWYTGSTNDLRKRFRQHNEGGSFSTKNRGPFQLIYYKMCKNEKDARSRELFLKSGMGKRCIKNRLKRSLSLTG